MITFATQAETQEFEKAIRRVNYDPTIIDGHDWLKNHDKEFFGAFVIFLDRKTECYAKIAEALERKYIFRLD